MEHANVTMNAALSLLGDLLAPSLGKTVYVQDASVDAEVVYVSAQEGQTASDWHRESRPNTKMVSSELRFLPGHGLFYVITLLVPRTPS